MSAPPLHGGIARGEAALRPLRRPAPLLDVRGETSSFRTLLQRADDRFRPVEGAKPPEDADAKAREAAERFVASALVEPILRQLRETNNAAAPFGPGVYEKRLGPMLDAQVADRIVRASRFPLVDRLARELRADPGAQEKIHGITA